MDNIVVTLRRLLDMHPRGMRIGSYQRHYVWGQERDSAADSVTYLTECLLEAFAHGREYFLQSVTLHGDHLVDGQQRLTYLLLLLRRLGRPASTTLRYTNRPEAASILAELPESTADEDPRWKRGLLEESEDAFFMLRTVEIIDRMVECVDAGAFAEWLLDSVQFLYVRIPDDNDAVMIYQMMNGTKAPMMPTDLIKADIMRIASDIDQPLSSTRSLYALRSRYASEWDTWVRWWNTSGVRSYYGSLNPNGLSLLLRLALRDEGADLCAPLTYSEFGNALGHASERAARAKLVFHRMRGIQKRIEGAYADTTAFNRIKAILLLQSEEQGLQFLHMYFVGCSIDADELERYYKLSFLGMDIDAIRRGDSPDEPFADLYEALSQPDVYHSEAKRDAYYLLLRLNIDEDIKLGRNFDFSVWSNRSLEHIFSKSKVWHLDDSGRMLDGNDNVIRLPRKRVESDPSYMRRDSIVTRSGMPLSEHCIGNLVLLYGQNNSEFGNMTFEQKKTMFLTPGSLSAFRSRNLLHSVCVFAGKSWTSRSIAENYLLTLKNLKLYYGYK